MWNNSLAEIVKYCSLRSQCEMKFAHICEANISHLQSKYFTAKLFHLPAGQISLKKALANASAFFWWGMVDSDHRSQWQQIYSLPPLAARERSHMKLWSWWTDSNPRPADYKSAALPLSHTSVSFTGTRKIIPQSPPFVNTFFKIFFFFSFFVYSSDFSF